MASASGTGKNEEQEQEHLISGLGAGGAGGLLDLSRGSLLMLDPNNKFKKHLVVLHFNGCFLSSKSVFWVVLSAGLRHKRRNAEAEGRPAKGKGGGRGRAVV